MTHKRDRRIAKSDDVRSQWQAARAQNGSISADAQRNRHRCGEIWQLKWNEVDSESKVVNITAEKERQPTSNPSKQQNARNAQQTAQRLWRQNLLQTQQAGRQFREPIQFPAQTPIKQAQQHKTDENPLPLRYWKGTMIYHETKDIYYSMRRLGHKTSKTRYSTSNSKKHSSKAKQTTSQKSLKQRRKSAV